jgi:hypothetical protein
MSSLSSTLTETPIWSIRSGVRDDTITSSTALSAGASSAEAAVAPASGSAKHVMIESAVAQARGAGSTLLSVLEKVSV